MTLKELKENIQKFQYMEDSSIIDVALASILCTSLSIGKPIWLVIIGKSSGGKTQILTPLAMTNEAFIHSVDDITGNTFLSGAKVGVGKSASFLDRVGKRGIIVISDLTVLFSKEATERAIILGALRVISDGKYQKYVGNNPKPLVWKGDLGMLAGSTPALYPSFEEFSGMGERFLYFRMREFDAEKATMLAMEQEIYGEELNIILSGYYKEYITSIIEYKTNNEVDLTLSEDVNKRIIKIAILAEKIRTTAHTDWQKVVDRLPIPAMPMRIAKMLRSLAKTLLLMRKFEKVEFGIEDMKIVDWCGWSLSNEEKRACLRILAGRDYGNWIKTQTVADLIGLDTTVIRILLQNLSAIGVLSRSGDSGSLMWKIADRGDWELIREIEGITESVEIAERDLSLEEEGIDIDVKGMFGENNNN